MKKGQALLLVFSWIFLVFDFANAQSSNPENFVIKHWGMAEGLPQSSVNDIHQTQDGYIWMATFGGLVRFDGDTFETFDRSNTPCLISDRLLRIYPDSEGGIWLFPDYTDITVIRFKNGNCTNYLIQNELTNYTQMTEDKEGKLWFIVDKVFYQFDNDRFVQVEAIESDELKEKALQKDGTWFGSGRNLYKSIDDKIVLIAKDIAGKDSDIIRIIEHPLHNNVLLVGTGNDGIYTVDVENEPKVKSIKKLPYSHFLDFRIGIDQSVYSKTVEGITKLVDGEHVRFTTTFEEPDVKMKTFVQDTDGNYWVGTEGDGLYRLRESFITMIDKDSGLDNTKMLSLTTKSNGNKLLSTNCGGIYEWDGVKAKPAPLHQFIEKGCYWSVLEDTKQRIWVGGGAPYLFEDKNKPAKLFDESDGYNSFAIFAIKEMSDGTFWIGAGDGLNIYDGSTFTKYTTDNGLYYDDARAFYEDDDGTIWIGTKGGLNRYKNGVISKFPIVQSDGTNNVVQPEIRYIHKDDEGYYWLGTYGSGLFRVNGDEVVQFTTKDGMFDNVVSHVVEDEFGYFWMGSNRGISRVSKSDLNAYANDKSKKFTVYNYGINDGMNSAETNGGFYPNIIQDDGKIYFPTVEGVAVVNTRRADKNSKSPPVYIETVETSDSVFVNVSSVQLPYDDTFIQIDYTAIELSYPDKVKFRYMMEGYHNSWVEAKAKRSVIFSNIPPGEYDFIVQASNSDGNWMNPNSASFSIIVVPPFWQTTWFYTLLTLFFIAIGPVYFYYRTNQLKKENERQKRLSEQLINSQEAERRRIASELHDSLGQQILVIKNRAELAKIHGSTNAEIIDQLNEIVNSAHTSIKSVRSISHNLRPIHLEKFGLTESLESLCMEMQGSTKVDWSYHISNIDGAIPKHKEINFYRVVQEALNNIIKHSGATEASVIIQKDEADINGKIWDNGRGFENEKLDQISSLGFLGMRERIENLNGTIKISAAQKNGVTLTFNIPISV